MKPLSTGADCTDRAARTKRNALQRMQQIAHCAAYAHTAETRKVFFYETANLYAIATRKKKKSPTLGEHKELPRRGDTGILTTAKNDPRQ